VTCSSFFSADCVVMAQVSFGVLNPPRRILMGPGPSDTHPRVLSALAAPTVGHLDPYFL